MFTLEVGEGASLQDGNNKDLSLNENRQYTTNMDFSGNATHNFTVTAQDGANSATYTVGVLQQQMDSKEIISFAFRETDNPLLKENIAMDIDSNSRAITKTVTNVEGITGLIPTIVHSGSNISPASGVAQDFSTAKTYTVTASDKTTSDYTVTLTRYYGVIFNANGGLISADPTATEYILYGEKVSPPSDPSREHYGFKGWYDAITGGNIFDFTTTDITTQTIIYARWTNKQYKVSFDADGGSAIDPVTVDSLTPVAKPADPTPPEHYSSLEGWYTDGTFTTRYDFNWVVSNDLTLYAKYINKQYQVRFYRGTDLLDTVLVVSLTAIPASDYPTPSIKKQLYKWYSDSGLANVYDKSSPVVGNLDLYAKVLTTDIKSIIENGVIPSDLANYDDISKMIFSHYIAGADVIARYVKETGTGNSDGSSWANASGDIQAMIDGIGDASESRIYVVLMASGIYKPSSSYVMKNHVALVGGFIADSYDRLGETHLDGNNDKRVFNNNFYNDNNGLDSTALLYGVVIANVNVVASYSVGGGMFNDNASPTLINVVFSSNKARGGGGMYNSSSSPTLINVTFSGNEAVGLGGNFGGGGMHNNESSPTLINVTFSGNEAEWGGGMLNTNFSSPILINTTFFNNTANYKNGGGIYHSGGGQPLTLINTILWNNNNGNIYLHNDHADTETVNLYYSVIEGGIIPSTTANGIRLENDDTVTYPIEINSEEVIDEDPILGILADNGGEINTISIGNNSPTKDKGVYVGGVKTENIYPETNLYYSIDNTDWYSDPGLTTQESPPNDADDLTATDARGYGRVGRPDIGAYEAGGTAP